MTNSDTDHLTQLGGESALPASPDVAVLERVANPHPDTDYVARFTAPEFTSLCPVTGQPDFATLTIQYIPDKKILESKSLKFYLWSYRQKGVFHEHVTNLILDDLVKALKPRWCRVHADFAVRGGISITVEAEFKK